MTSNAVNEKEPAQKRSVATILKKATCKDLHCRSSILPSLGR